MANNSSNVSINFTALKTCNDKIKSEMGKLNENIKRLKTNGKFSKSEWNDASADTFNNSMDTYIAGLTNFNNVISKVNTYLNKKMDDYKSLDGMKMS